MAQNYTNNYKSLLTTTAVVGPVYLSVFDDAHGFLGCEEGEVGEADSCAVCEVYEPSHLGLLVL